MQRGELRPAHEVFFNNFKIFRHYLTGLIRPDSGPASVAVFLQI